MEKQDLMLKLIDSCEIKEPQLVGNISMIGLCNPNAPEESPVISLRNALKQRKISIRETGGSYTQLQAQAETPTLIRSSEGVSKAGLQDRVVRESQVVHEPRTLEVYCIEHGRWGKGAKKEWAPVNLPVPIRRAVMEGRPQNEIWSMINDYLKEWKVKSRSDALSAIFDALGQQFEKFVANFEWWPSQIGMVIVINNVVSGLEFFGAKKTFQIDGMGLLRESYVPEALRGDKVPMLPGDVTSALTGFMDEIKTGNRRMDYVEYKGQVVYASAI